MIRIRKTMVLERGHGVAKDGNRKFSVSPHQKIAHRPCEGLAKLCPSIAARRLSRTYDILLPLASRPSPKSLAQARRQKRAGRRSASWSRPRRICPKPPDLVSECTKLNPGVAVEYSEGSVDGPVRRGREVVRAKGTLDVVWSCPWISTIKLAMTAMWSIPVGQAEGCSEWAPVGDPATALRPNL